jgi:hypothetical protein
MGFCGMTLQNVDLRGGAMVLCTPNAVAEIMDVMVALEAFRRRPDPCLTAISCP